MNEFELKAAKTLGDLFYKSPAKATQYVNAIMGNRLVPPATKKYFGELLEEFRNVEFEGGASVPFAPRKTFENVVAAHGLDGAAAKTCVTYLKNDHICAGLMQQMGTDKDRVPEPPTLRDQVEAAYDIHVKDES